MKCGGCDKANRVCCSYDISGVQCRVTGNINGYFDECDVTERQKLIYLLDDMGLGTTSDVEYVADYLLEHGVSVIC